MYLYVSISCWNEEADLLEVRCVALCVVGEMVGGSQEGTSTP